MTPLEPIPRARALVPWKRRIPVEPLSTFDPDASSPEAIAFLERIARDIATALGLPLEEVRIEGCAEGRTGKRL